MSLSSSRPEMYPHRFATSKSPASALTMFEITPSGIRMSPVSTVPKVIIEVTVSVVRFSDKISTFVEAMSFDSM